MLKRDPPEEHDKYVIFYQFSFIGIVDFESLMHFALCS